MIFDKDCCYCSHKDYYHLLLTIASLVQTKVTITTAFIYENKELFIKIKFSVFLDFYFLDQDLLFALLFAFLSNQKLNVLILQYAL